MVKFFNKTYKHAYKRGNIVYIQGSIDNQKFNRISTGKVFSQANMNFAEKNWESIFKKFYEDKQNHIQRDKMPTLSEFVEKSFEMSLENVESNTVDSYKQAYYNHINKMFGIYKMDEIKNDMILSWQRMLREDKKFSRNTIMKVRVVFSVIFQHAIEIGIIEKNPIRSTKAPRKKLFISFDENGNRLNHKGNLASEDEVSPFTLDEVYKLIELSKGQFKNIITVLFFTGMRTGEMVSLKWSDIDWENKTIYIQRAMKKNGVLGVPKNGKSRKVDILEPVYESLKNQFQLSGLKNGFIFESNYKERYKSYNALRVSHWMPLLRRAGFDKRTLYQTRHTFASIMLSKGENIMWVSSKMLGHAEVTTTLKFYARYIKEEKQVHASFLNKCTNSVQMNDAGLNKSRKQVC